MPSRSRSQFQIRWPRATRAGCIVALTAAIDGTVALPAVAASWGEPRLVEDLATGPARWQEQGEPASNFVVVGGRVLYIASDEVGNSVLFASDGTEVEALLAPAGFAYLLGSTSQLAFYLAWHYSYIDNTTAIEVWRTDGTREGTMAVGPLQQYCDGYQPRSMVSGDRLYYVAAVGPHDGSCTLWSTDGTPQGTRRAGRAAFGQVITLAPMAQTGPQGDVFVLARRGGDDGPVELWATRDTGRGMERLRATPDAHSMVEIAGRAYLFTATPKGVILLTSDGTRPGTHAVRGFGFDGDDTWYARIIGTHGGRLLFTAPTADNDRGTELFVATENRATRLTRWTSPYVSAGEAVPVGNGMFLFPIYDDNGFELWRSGGTPSSTRRLQGCPGGCPRPAGGSLVSIGQGRAVFYGHDSKRDYGFWVTDGTGAGTRRVASTEGWSDSQAVVAGGRAVFELTSEYDSTELWLVDGTEAGTFLVGEGIHRVSHYYGWSGVTEAAAVPGGPLLFPGRQGEGPVVWATRSAPRELHAFVSQAHAAGSRPEQLTPFGDGVIELACLGGLGELRYADANGSRPLMTDPSPDVECAGFNDIVVNGGTAVFNAWYGEDLELWSTDGTAAGTRQIVPVVAPGDVQAAIAFGDRFVFWTAEEPGVNRLRWTDGTSAGTLLDLPADVEPYELAAAGGRLYFLDSVRVGENWLQQPWSSDGTAGGTGPIAAPRPSAWPPQFTAVGDEVFFRRGTANDDNDDDTTELWRTDGTAAGTRLAVPAGEGIANPWPIAAIGDQLFFLSANGESSEAPGATSGALWSTDGTVTRRLASLPPDGLWIYDSPVAVFDGRLFFPGFDEAHGVELWSSDGSPEGTALLADLAPGQAGSVPRNFAASSDGIVFAAVHPAHGRELWTSDGSAEGTVMHEIVAGVLSSSPWGHVASGDGVFFSAHDPEHGRELWLVPSP